jgi:acyl-CoA dehydrogenase
MSEVSESLREAAAQLLEREIPSAGAEFSPALWEKLESVEFPRVGIPETAGGSGGGVEEAVALARTFGYFAVPAPVVETGMLAGRLLAESGARVPRGPLAYVEGPDLRLARSDGGWLLDGFARRVPWARVAARLVVVSGGSLAEVDPALARVTPGTNLAGEPRDDVEFSAVRLPSSAVRDLPAGVTADVVRAWGALGRSAQIAGALERILEITVEYAQNREQFGRPISKFQALQHGAAAVAGDLAATLATLESAVERDDVLTMAQAKIVSSAAVGPATRFAHQVHGALGFTDEHPLYRYTTRLWAWRDEFGSDETWAIHVGRLAAGAGGGLWELLA